MKLYTRTGDDGGTALFGGERVDKHHPRVAAYGAVDEANATLGLCAACDEAASLRVGDESLREMLTRLMSDLFDVGAELATPPSDEDKLTQRMSSSIGAGSVLALEGWIDEADAELEPLKTFVLPTGTELAARLHLARSVVRRAEREVVSLSRDHGVRPDVIHHLNRLSDLLFAWARLANHRSGAGDVAWRPAPQQDAEDQKSE